MAKFNSKEPFKYVNSKLTGEQADAFKKWSNDKDHLLDKALDDMFASGYKVAFSWDDKNDCFIGSLVSKIEKSENANRCLTARSDNWLEVIALLAYKHTVLFKSGIWEDGNSADNWG